MMLYCKNKIHNVSNKVTIGHNSETNKSKYSDPLQVLSYRDSSTILNFSIFNFKNILLRCIIWVIAEVYILTTRHI